MNKRGKADNQYCNRYSYLNSFKKGVSAIVATVLLVVITIALAGIIYGAIVPLVKDNLETSQKCSSTGIEIVTGEGYTCYDSGKSEVKIQVSRGEQEINLSGLQLQISGGGKSKSVEINSSMLFTGSAYIREYSGNYRNSSGTNTNFNITLPGKLGAIPYVINITSPYVGITSPDSVSVAPIIKIGIKNNICGIVSKTALSNC